MDTILQLQARLTQTSKLLGQVSFFEEQCAAVEKVFIELERLLSPRTSKIGNKMAETYFKDVDLAFMLSESVRRVSLFVNLYLVDDLDNCYTSLRRCWTLLNSRSLLKSFCKKIRDIFSLTARLLPTDKRKMFNRDFKKIIQRPVTRSVLIAKFDLLVPKIDKKIDGILFRALCNFFTGTNEFLDQPVKVKYLTKIYKFTNKDHQLELESLMHDTEKLTKKIEFNLFQMIGIKENFETDLLQCKQIIKRDNFEPIKFHSTIEFFTTAAAQNEMKKKSNGSNGNLIGGEDIDLFEIIQEIKLFKQTRDDLRKYFMLPNNYNCENNIFSLSFKNIKTSLNTVLCNNKRHALYDFTEFETLAIGLSVTSALKYIHSLGFVHDQVTAKNIFISMERENNSGGGKNKKFLDLTSIRGGEKKLRVCSIKLANFKVNQSETTYPPDVNLKNIEDLEYLEDFISTSPEVILSQECLTSNDIYSLAFLFWRLLHFKKTPISCLFEPSQSSKQIVQPMSGLLTNKMGQGSKQLINFKLNKHNNLSYLSRQQMVRKISKLVLKGHRPKLFNVEDNSLRRRLMEIVSQCWTEEACERPSSNKLVRLMTDLFTKYKPENQTFDQTISEIPENLRNGQNRKLKALFKRNPLEKDKKFMIGKRPQSNTTLASSVNGSENSLNPMKSYTQKTFRRTKTRLSLFPKRKKSMKPSDAPQKQRTIKAQRTLKAKRRKSKKLFKKKTKFVDQFEIERADEIDVVDFESDEDLEQKAFESMATAIDETRSQTSRLRESVRMQELNESFRLI